MYLSYENLWTRLAALGIRKTELMELTGMSSRTLSKLSKNEPVNMETVMKICEVLHCRVEDVLTVSETYTPLSLYDAYCHTAVKTEENANVILSDVGYGGKKYWIYVTKKKADKLTVITCRNNTVLWGQMPILPRLTGTQFLVPVDIFIERVRTARDRTTVFVISGKPGSIEGLDDGIFRSARHPGGEGFVNVMSEAAFKTFLPLG